ncbi:WxL domain-containing protein [Enterococcus faecalis]|uniref:WxL domain-containing protein n=5 Tax=Enterococcus faecalis TaxID=1351 RepID=UPI0012E11312|nr:WxL domain-containing protein [Enterococcus faecalis]EGO5015745.1 WxL domain-containing protein [Enterococcus faecalis]EGO7560341.1 WxL domain-containing protein [Enterococcus faecalis]EGO7741901.1 WxL domain-containing protein [Enterococcus faecalis]EGO8389520.1 WxL domain-containing protein [Enterococcus faecalis]EGO8844888.1 WxL domain-containing protein [Enterococcus faecalis]
MKQTKWQRLATIGLCSSLVINAFSGVTAVAETITIESSPTVASSAKEATSASSATPASTESSQETTETSREEVTQETEKPEVVEEETEAKKQEEETVTSEVVQPNPVLAPTPVSGIGVRAGNLAETYQYFLEIQKKFQINGSQAQVVTPNIAIGVNLTSSEGGTVNIDDFELSSTVRTRSSLWDPSYGGYRHSYSTPENISSTKLTNGIQINIPSKIVRAQANTTYTRVNYGFYLENVSLSVPKYISNVLVGEPLSRKLIQVGGFTMPAGTLDIKKINQETYNLETSTNTTTNTGIADSVFSTVVDHSWDNRSGFGTVLAEKDLELSVVFKKVTESFKDTAGATIPAPTGFTQGKQTSITSNNYTFKQAGTLPETYKASNGKTYKFKGWYKGKTKPNTLTTTKAPSYAVTYDDNDDLNVVYEEIKVLEFPSRTYQFGFVDESGKRVDASTIDLTYDNWYGIGTEPPNNIPSAWATTKIETGIKANTKNNLKEIIYPVQYLETNSNDSFQFSAVNLRYQLPRIYKSISIQNQQGGFDAAYPYPSILNPSGAEINNTPQYFELKNNGGQEFVFNRTTAAAPENVQLPFYLRYVSSFLTGKAMYYTIQGPIYYYLTNRRVTENFVDANGTKITPPTGFTQGKQTVINSDPYTFKQSGTLPDTYTTGGKTYKFKGWYKGKTKPNTLTTTKAPSYAVTYDDNDDLNVVYEEVNFPETTYQFGFVNEAGQLVNPDDINLTYDYKSIVYRGTGAAGSTVSFGTIANNQSGVKVGNLRQVTLPAKNIAQPTVVGWNGEAFANFSINLPKYYKSLNLYDKTGKIDPKYPLPVKTTVSSVSNDTVQPEANVIAELTLTQRADGSFTPRETYSGIDSSVRYPPFLRRTVSYSSSGSITALYQTISGPVYYHLTNRKVTENFVNTSGAKITPPTGFTQGKQIPMTSNTFKYTSAKALPASYSAGGKTYVFQGWYKGKTKPNTLTTSTTPAYNTTFDDNDDMTAVYKEANISANLTMRGAVDVIDNGATMEYWEVLLKNTGEAPLTSVKIKPTTDWATGISTPTELFILGTGQNTKVRPITKEQWEAGFEIPLDSSIPVGGQLTINLLGTKVTGQPNQVLKAAVEFTGNFSKLTASDTVRIKDLDQETKEPTGEGFISVPTFNFGQVGVAGSTQQHSLKKAADYYGNGTRNPYLRIKKTQPNWSLTAQLSQPKSATDSLPTATRLLLGAAPVSSFSNYNQPTELKNAVGTTSTISLNANNTATRIIANQQFTGSNIYQLDFTFNNVKLEVPANQGVKGQQYQAAITWNLVTGP